MLIVKNCRKYMASPVNMLYNNSEDKFLVYL